MTKGVQDLMYAVERVRDEFHSAVYTAGDLDAALALTSTDCALLNIPAGTGAGSAARFGATLPRTSSRTCPRT